MIGVLAPVRVRAMVVVACAAALVAAGCGSDDTSTSTGATTTSSPPAATATTATPVDPGDPGDPGATAPPATPARPAGEFDTTQVSVPPGGQEGPALLSAVRAAAQTGFDRVTFEFANYLPGYSVDFVTLVLQDGSGEEVAVEGAGKLQVRMVPASSVDLSAGGTPTYAGPPRFSPGTPAVVEVVQVGDFEGNLTWVIGTSSTTGFKVSTLDAPPRLVVDVRAG